LFIEFLNYILNYMHFAHTQAPRFALHDFHDPDRSRNKKSFRKKKNVDNHI